MKGRCSAFARKDRCSCASRRTRFRHLLSDRGNTDHDSPRRAFELIGKLLPDQPKLKHAAPIRVELTSSSRRREGSLRQTGRKRSAKLPGLSENQSYRYANLLFRPSLSRSDAHLGYRQDGITTQQVWQHNNSLFRSNHQSAPRIRDRECKPGRLVSIDWCFMSSSEDNFMLISL